MENNDNYNEEDCSMELWRETEVFKKGVLILKLVEHLTDGISREESGASTAYEFAMYEHHTTSMMENALLIPLKIAGAEGDNGYDHKMENATVIRKAAREIITDTRGLQIARFKEVEYLELIRKEIEAFRPIFAEWIKTFNTANPSIDRWGLFNPPGINYNDMDLDKTDDIF